MRTFDYTSLPSTLAASEVTNLLLMLREYKGGQTCWSATQPDVLESLAQVAKVQSVGSSNSIEGIVTTEKRLRALVVHAEAPRTHDEGEIAGYRDVLNLIYEQAPYIPVSPGTILQLHRDLMKHAPVSYGGRWKDSDNAIVAHDAQGNTYVRFRPTPAIATPDAIAQLCETYRRAVSLELFDPLLLAMRFIFDFVSIHPFNDGNGRMSRLLTVLLMEQAGYTVGRYVSIERRIEQTKTAYYEALAKSSVGWETGDNDEAPFIVYMLGVILAAYRELEQRVGAPNAAGQTKADRVREVLSRHLGKVTKAMILEECPDISETTVKRALAAMVQRGEIRKVGSGKETGYVWVDGR